MWTGQNKTTEMGSLPLRPGSSGAVALAGAAQRIQASEDRRPGRPWQAHIARLGVCHLSGFAHEISDDFSFHIFPHSAGPLRCCRSGGTGGAACCTGSNGLSAVPFGGRIGSSCCLRDPEAARTCTHTRPTFGARCCSLGTPRIAADPPCL